MSQKLLSLEDYENFLHGLKERIRHSQMCAALSVNRELILLYWQIGHEILTRQQQHGWGAKVIDRFKTLKAGLQNPPNTVLKKRCA